MGQKTHVIALSQSNPLEFIHCKILLIDMSRVYVNQMLMEFQ